MAGAILATVKVPGFDGMPKDSAVNNWVIGWTSGSTGLALSLCAPLQVALTTFYSAIHVDLSPHHDWAHSQLEVYDITGHLDGSPHGSPIYVGVVASSAPPDNLGLPNGCCICLSYHCDYGTDFESAGVDSAIPTQDWAQDQGAPATHAGRARPRSRDRGRLYIGPLDQGTVDNTTGLTGQARPGGTTLDRIRHAAYAFLVDTTISALTGYWGVWSRRNASVKPITGGNVANSFTYQRGREIAPTSRLAIGP
jgi:hypothetical protein